MTISEQISGPRKDERDLRLLARTNRIGRSCLAAAAIVLLSGCNAFDSEKMGQIMSSYAPLPAHKAMVIDKSDDRAIWVSGKGSDLDAIQLAEILCVHATDDPEECVLAYVDDHQLYDPVSGDAVLPDSRELADVLYEAGIKTKTPD